MSHLGDKILSLAKELESVIENMERESTVETVALLETKYAMCALYVASKHFETPKDQ